MAKTRLNIEVNSDLALVLDELAETEDVTRTEIVRRAIAMLKAYSDQRKVGRSHVGFAASPVGFDSELVGILTSRVAEQETKPSLGRTRKTQL